MTPKSFMDSAKLAVTLAAFLPLGSSSKGMSRAKEKVFGALWDMEIFRPNSVLNYALLFQSNLTLVGPSQVVAIVDTNCSTVKFLFEKFQYFQRIIKYPELEGTHKGHRVQILAPYRTTQKVDHMSESMLIIFLIIKLLIKFLYNFKVMIKDEEGTTTLFPQDSALPLIMAES